MPGKGRLSMLDRFAAPMHDRASSPELAARRLQARRRARALATSLAVAAVLHLAVLDRLGDWTRAAPESTAMALSVRTIVSRPEPGPVAHELAIAAPPIELAAAALPVAPPVAKARPERRPREPAPTLVDPPPAIEEASAGSADLRVVALAAMEPASAVAEAPVGVKSPRAKPPAAITVAAGASAPASLPGAEDRPPPVYRTRLPPPATLHYEVRRGILSGEGQIRWQRVGDGYRLVLEASVAGLTLLMQTSEGAIDANGIAPVRFVDQRARRAAQAANFVRDAGKITFSGTAVEWPLLAGSQDRLSWMIQLAGIAAAQPELLVDGGRISMAVAGARGEADVWTLHSVGVETVETRRGAVRAVKLVRDAHSAHDTGAEIWLDPEHSYLPARATQRNGSGAVEFDLLLERIDP
jgi:hypothetical protein